MTALITSARRAETFDNSGAVIAVCTSLAATAPTYGVAKLVN
jgi:hypothetical protein